MKPSNKKALPLIPKARAFSICEDGALTAIKYVAVLLEKKHLLTSEQMFTIILHRRTNVHKHMRKPFVQMKSAL